MRFPQDLSVSPTVGVGLSLSLNPCVTPSEREAGAPRSRTVVKPPGGHRVRSAQTSNCSSMGRKAGLQEEDSDFILQGL
jgi:hypothetical protein